MKPAFWHKQHKWWGLVAAFFLAMLGVSGIALNHRGPLRHAELSRAWLPPHYAFERWNGGLFRGTLESDSAVLIYGSNGVWQADSLGHAVRPINDGLPTGDGRNVRRIVRAADGNLYAAALYGLYHLDGNRWHSVELPLAEDERLTDIETVGDSVVVLSRDRAFVVVAGEEVSSLEMSRPEGYEGKVTLFRIVWMLHSGELFGMGGRIAADLLGLVFLLLCVTGVTFFALRGRGRRWSLVWHSRTGQWTIVLTLLMAVTGWCLRPPVMIPLALTKTAPPSGTALDSDNPFHDKLRMLRYDADRGDWLLSTSDGFFSLDSLRAVPRQLESTPPVSVMGLNVWERDGSGRWLCGSFSGMYVWDRSAGSSTDWFTGEVAPLEAGPPFGKRAVAGYSADFGRPFVVEYDAGTDAIPQPEWMRHLPMSAWNVALEIHSGRIYMGNIATYIFIFLAGIAAVWTLWTGYRLLPRRRK